MVLINRLELTYHVCMCVRKPLEFDVWLWHVKFDSLDETFLLLKCLIASLNVLARALCLPNEQ